MNAITWTVSCTHSASVICAPLVSGMSWRVTACSALNPVMTESHRFIVLGTGGAFTYTVLKTLIRNKLLPVVYIQSGDRQPHEKSSFADIPLEVNKPRSPLSELLEAQSIPSYYPSELELAELVKQQHADFLLVACWPDLLSDRVLRSVAKAALNLHPSLLPKYRGIDPVSAQLTASDFQFGVTLHLLNAQFDTGDIVRQAILPLTPGRDKSAIEASAAKQGALLFLEALATYHKPGWDLTQQTD